MTTSTALPARHRHHPRRPHHRRPHHRVATALVAGALVTGLAAACGQAPSPGPGTSPSPSPSRTATASPSPTTPDDAGRKAAAQRLLLTGPVRSPQSEPSTTPLRDGVVVASWSPGPDVRTLRLHFTGAPAEAGACGADYRAMQWSSATTVVVAVLEVPRAAPPSGVACPAIAVLRTVDVTLAEPPAGRMVISLAGGSEVPRTTGQADGIPAR